MSDKQRFVRQYVQRQRAYVPTYTADRLLDERPGTPVKLIQSDQFGFDTPVLRPRVVDKTELVGPSARESKPGLSEPRPKRKKASTPLDTDDERAARLADRRERKRSKRAIVNPPQKHDEDSVHSAASKMGRTKAQKRKEPAALALLYGFSATNVTKDRLTVKPAPSLGVFSKGKASAKKKVTATKKSSSKDELFSELAFLNKSNHSRVAHDSDDGSASGCPTPQAALRTREDATVCAETTKHATVESEVWDIELQSKLPSSVPGVLSEPGANDSASVALNLGGAEWSASLHAAGEHEGRHCNPRRSMSITGARSVVRASSLARSDLCDVPRAEDEAPSIHPSHSASQVGRRAADMQPPDLRRAVRSKYFSHPEPAAIHQFVPEPLQALRSDDSLDVLNSRMPDQDVQDAETNVQTILRVTSPMNSLVSAVQPLAEFRSQYDVAPLKFPSDCSPYDDWYARGDEAMEHLGDHGYFESSVECGRSVGIPAYDLDGDVDSGVEYYHCPFQCCASPGLDDDDVVSQGYDPLEYENGELIATDAQPYCCDSDIEDDSLPEFLEGRALLLDISEWPRRDGLSGLAQAERDVADRLRHHWRPLRLS